MFVCPIASVPIRGSDSRRLRFETMTKRKSIWQRKSWAEETGTKCETTSLAFLTNARRRNITKKNKTPDIWAKKFLFSKALLDFVIEHFYRLICFVCVCLFQRYMWIWGFDIISKKLFGWHLLPISASVFIVHHIMRHTFPKFASGAQCSTSSTSFTSLCHLWAVVLPFQSLCISCFMSRCHQSPHFIQNES